jgi:DNA relaxase NicK
MIGHYSSTTKVGDKWLPGDTVYIGSPKSDIQLTIYNKAAEQKQDGDWLRIEITWRGKHAHEAHMAMLRASIGAVVRAAIQHQMDFSSEWWLSAMHGVTSQPDLVRKSTGGRLKWLIESVMPALEKEIDEQRRHNSDEIYEIFAAFMDRKKPVQ